MSYNPNGDDTLPVPPPPTTAQGAPQAGAPPPDDDQGPIPSPSQFAGNVAGGVSSAMGAAGDYLTNIKNKAAGALPSNQNGPQPSPEDAMNVQGAPPTIMKYLSGAEAAPRQVVDALEQKVDPNNTMDQNERTMRTIEAAAKDSPDVGWGVMQHYRASYNSMLSGTGVALAKGANPEIVTQNFNAAMSYLPDGNKVTAKPAQSGGYQVQVHGLDGQTQQYQLSPEQLNDFIHNSSVSAYDSVMRPDNPDQVNHVLQQLQGSEGRAIQSLKAAGGTNAGGAPPATPYGGQKTNPASLPPGQNGLPNGYQEQTQRPNPEGETTPPGGRAATKDDPFSTFDPDDVTKARYMTNGNMQQMLQILTQNQEKQQEREANIEASTRRGQGAAEARATAPPRAGSDTAAARNLRNQSTIQARQAHDYDQTVSALQKNLLGQINDVTGKNYTPKEALQEALGEVQSRGMNRPSFNAPASQEEAPDVAGGNRPNPGGNRPNLGAAGAPTAVAPMQNTTAAPAKPAGEAGPAGAAPVTGRAAVKANQPEVRRDGDGNLWTKDARGQVVPYQPPQE